MNDTEKRIIELIDENAEKLISFARDVAREAEPGFREVETARKTANFLESLGLSVRENIALTGLRAEMKRAENDITVGIIGELDGIKCPTHPLANPRYGTAHACCHNGQLCALVGAAVALCEPSVRAELGGNVSFMAIPAEEHVDAAVADELIDSGKIKYQHGKTEWVSIGELSDVDIVCTNHVKMVPCQGDLVLGSTAALCNIAKVITVRGVAAHAGAAPHKGVNALNAACLGMSALGMLRETFRDEDHIRVHPVIKKGGDAVNVVPHEVVIETLVRARTLDALREVNAKVDNAFIGAASALGATCEIKNYLGMLPVLEEKPIEALKRAASACASGLDVREIPSGLQNCASTDVGDLMHIMPVVNFYFDGVKGSLHSADFEVVDEYMAYILPAKQTALTVYHLLCDNAREAKKLKQSYKPVFTREEYLDIVNTLSGAKE